METTIRNTTLETLIETLHQQQAAKVDAVVPASDLRFNRGRIQFDLPEPEITSSGVITALDLLPTGDMIGGLASKAGIPVRYLRRLYESSIAADDTWIETKAGLLDGSAPWMELLEDTLETHYGATNNASYLIRGYHGEDGIGTGRAILSNRFRAIDNLDIIMATLKGVNDTGLDVQVTQCNLTERNMRVRFAAPAMTALAPELLEGYRTPFERPGGGGHGQAGLRDEDGNLPVCYAGFEISNSETGSGAAKITPIITVKVCTNGMVINSLAEAYRHTGGKLQEGTVDWSAGTQRKAIELITSQTSDIVSGFLSQSFLTEQIEALTLKAGKPVGKPKAVIERVGQKLSWSDEEQDTILSMFIKGGQSTAGGIMQAVTAAAQVVEDPDRAWEIESAGIEAMGLV